MIFFAKRCYSFYSVGQTVARKKVTLRTIEQMYRKGIPISMTTAYDVPTAQFADSAGIDLVLAGDSVANIALGLKSTSELSFKAMLHHCQAVRKGLQGAFLIGDLPFGSYEVSDQEAVRNSISLVQEAGVDAVKLEGTRPSTIRAISSAGILAMGHIGLTPQTAAALSGYRVQGKSVGDAVRLLNDALSLQEAGACMLVLEALPQEVAGHITKRLSIPTISVGAGLHCSGQALVQGDLTGANTGERPKFAKKYGNVAQEARNAISMFIKEVKDHQFPEKEHTYGMNEGQEERLDKSMQEWDEAQNK